MAINERQAGDSGYIALFKGRRCEVYAKTILSARDRAAAHFKARKAYEVVVTRAEDEAGEAVVHVPDF